MDFIRSYFDTNESLTSLTLFSSLFVQISADLEKKWGQKGSTGQRFICIEVTSYKIHTLEDGETLIFNRLCPCSRPLRPASMALKKTKAFKRTKLAGTYNFVQILPCPISIWINEIGFNTQILKDVKTRTGVTFLLIRMRFLPIEKEKTSHSFWTKFVNYSKRVRPA